MENNPSSFTESGGSSQADDMQSGQGAQPQTIKTQVQEKAGEVLDQARSSIKEQATQQKDRAADGLESVATALHTTSDQLRGQQQAFIGEYVESAARVVENVSGYLQEHDVTELTGEVENFARRQPGIFLGACFAIGFVAVRFLKASGREAYSTAGNGNGYGAAGSYDVSTQPMALPETGTYGQTAGAG